MNQETLHFNIFQELQEWSKGLEIWERLALLRLLEKTKLDDNDIKEIFEEFCFDKDLKVIKGKRETYDPQLR